MSKWAPKEWQVTLILAWVMLNSAKLDKIAGKDSGDILLLCSLGMFVLALIDFGVYILRNKEQENKDA